MRVAMVDNSGGGGALRAGHEIARGLAARGHSVDLWTLGAGARPPIGVRARHAPGHRTLLDLGQLSIAAGPLAPLEARRLRRAYDALAAALDADDYDVVMSHGCRHVEHPWLARTVRAPLVSYVHALPRFVGDDDAPSRSLARRVALRVLRPWQRRLATASAAELQAATIVLANSHYTARALERAYGVRARVAHPGVDAQAFSPLARRRERTVLFPGLLCRQKRQELLVDALAGVAAARRPRLVLLFTAAAIGFECRLRARARAAGVTLELHRDPSQAELVEHYNRAGVVAVPSAREAFGLVALEAMACGTPIVAAAEGGMLETVEDGVTGRLVPPEPSAFAHALEALLDDDDERARLGGTGRARVLERWTWERSIDAIEPALLDAAGRRS